MYPHRLSGDIEAVNLITCKKKYIHRTIKQCIIAARSHPVTVKCVFNTGTIFNFSRCQEAVDHIKKYSDVTYQSCGPELILHRNFSALLIEYSTTLLPDLVNIIIDYLTEPCRITPDDYFTGDPNHYMLCRICSK